MLDLSKVGGANQKVKLPDGEIYDIAEPEQMGALDLQRAASCKRRADAIMAKPDATEADIEEMVSLLVDTLEVIVPGADRELLGKLPLPKMELLIDHFRAASLKGEGEATSDG